MHCARLIIKKNLFIGIAMYCDENAFYSLNQPNTYT